MTNRIAWPILRRSLVAILRGVRPDEVEGIVGALIEEGFEAIEVPLNSPDPISSIEKIAKTFGASCLIGGGTMLSVEDVDRVADVGGKLMVSPNVDPEVIARTTERGLVSMPGVFTPSEALLALKSGASALKFFPAGALGVAGISAIKPILPKDAIIGAVGGVSDISFADYAKIGIRTFGLGSSLYKPGDGVETVRTRAKAAIQAYDAAFAHE
ncbi:2-dehydro-3-deoxy-6-phosphogalactonate aldolase [Rhizobium sp. CFBP 8762]|uniref:2-dehydro-3-deoxy-6-phosphogalactonate aldolase n=1 Tax=Rhizobium sp. CFBP 8762 TaxID=2775279 RepID=UPI0017805449|nr:2-dehydro-3-deoxy-6-phosphogalactonate aldolase [Rhizobium sp. CFBP 8762]MBD8553997.1 2-dehydro-3-deoxy-6-phosphogalactonate aldolase [Rhizobium sp. CFBP 8762]